MTAELAARAGDPAACAWPGRPRPPVWSLYMIVASLSDKLSDNPPGLGRTLADSSGR